MIKNINSLQNPLIRHLIKLRKNKSYRLAQGSAIIQGKKNLYNICNRLKIKNLLVTEEHVAQDLEVENIYHVPLSVMRTTSGLDSPDGYLAEICLPKFLPLSSHGKTLILDRLQDPANIGTLCRTAHAFGWDRIILLTPSTDPYSDKVIRGSKASSLLVPIYQMTTEEVLSFFQDIPLYLADLGGAPYYKALPTATKEFALVLGQEAKGPSEELKTRASTILTIPIDKNVESINVAAAGSILMAHLSFYEAT